MINKEELKKQLKSMAEEAFAKFDFQAMTLDKNDYIVFNKKQFEKFLEGYSNLLLKSFDIIAEKVLGDK